MAHRLGTLIAAAASTLLCACGPALGKGPPAERGVSALVKALEAEDPHAAYDLLSADTRKKVSYEEFAIQWKASAAERKWQAARLTEALRGDPDVGERAAVTYPDGQSVSLEREGKRWRLESALVSQTRAARPRDAVRIFAEAIRHHDLELLLRTLTRRRREGLARQVDGFLAGIDRRVDGKLEEIGTDRAELRWDENGVRFRIVLRKEDDEWRIDDIHIHPVPEHEDDSDRSDAPPPSSIF